MKKLDPWHYTCLPAPSEGFCLLPVSSRFCCSLSSFYQYLGIAKIISILPLLLHHDNAEDRTSFGFSDLGGRLFPWKIICLGRIPALILLQRRALGMPQLHSFGCVEVQMQRWELRQRLGMTRALLLAFNTSHKLSSPHHRAWD